MKRPSLLIFAVACIAVIVFGTVKRFPDRQAFYKGEPSYRGKLLSEWLELCEKDHGSSGGYDEVWHIGSNAVPCLMKWIRYEPPQAKDSATYFRYGMTGFSILGTEARGAIPELTQMMQDWKPGSQRTNAVAALRYLGRDAFPPLLAVTTNRAAPTDLRFAAVYSIAYIGIRTNDYEFVHPLVSIVADQESPADVRMTAIRTLTSLNELGTNANPVVSALLQCLEDTDQDLVLTAANALGRFAEKPDLVVPALMRHLYDARNSVRAAAARSLGCFGEATNTVIPALIKLTSDPDFGIRYCATNVLDRIPSFAVPIFIKSLRGFDRELRLDATMRLVDFAKNARPAVPVLVECLEDNDSKVAAYSALALGRLALESDLVVPALTKTLQSTNPGLRNCGAKALGSFGPKASSAIPSLVNLLDDPHEKIRNSASNSILQISQTPTKKSDN